jgi:hypothetical protein
MGIGDRVRGTVFARGPGGVFTSSQIARQLHEFEDDVIPLLERMVADGWLRKTTTSVEWTAGEAALPVPITLYQNPLG